MWANALIRRIDVKAPVLLVGASFHARGSWQAKYSVFDRSRSNSVMQAASVAAPWMVPLKAALNHGGTKRPKRDRREAKRKHVQIATVEPTSGRPSVRTVSFRGFLTAAHTSGDPTLVNQESCMLTFITDSRAAKVRHLESGEAYVECCWWLDEAGVQFRLGGPAVVASHTSQDPQVRALCQTVWERLSSSTRQTFTWPLPGAPRERAASGESGSTQKPATTETLQDSSGDEGDAPPMEHAHFSVLVVLPERVDELRLGGRQRRVLYSLDAAAVHEAVTSQACLSSDLWWTATHWRAEEINP
eukprot:TRINITY_DN9494_c0_g1_i1.p1 TRINITY_DN9494_c0_g1~~TRINITY_DN9494_c0_g1_i1.p1  ORF type:complete len:302 (-),score=53.80 TRINITY_DN9494_c0_g1_i1:96-1001(-)